MTTFYANNVEEAVQLATEFKRDGKYDLFRGQLREWAPSSTLERKVTNVGEHRTCVARMERFLGWAQGHPSLSYLAEAGSEHQFFAILQHYGLPTAYVDFTSDPSVAGFFASEAESLPDGPGNSVIFCLSSAALSKAYAAGGELAARGDLEVVSPHVPDLWRLQAQHGHFVYANHPWHRYYEMDKIVFPWTGPAAYPPREQIYPEHKSALEELLDQFFFTEEQRENQAAFMSMVAELKDNESIKMLELEAFPDQYDAEAFSAPLRVLGSWSGENLASWTNAPDERFQATVGRSVPIRFRSSEQAPSVPDQLLGAIRGLLQREPEIRDSAVEWQVTQLPGTLLHSNFMDALRQAWNGMRRLPFDDEDIAVALSALADLCARPGCRSHEGGTLLHAFKQRTPDCLEVMFGSGDGTLSRAYCSQASLLKAIAEPWWQVLRADRSRIDMPSALFLTQDPRLMFDFGQFARIFAREIIPSQLAQSRSLVLFNPASIRTFGLA